MKLTFLGTRGNHDLISEHHRRHSAALLEADGVRIMVDCGSDWREDALSFTLDAVVLTHAHPDHAGGVGPELDCPVYASATTWAALEGRDLAAKRILRPDRPLVFGSLEISAAAVAHSLRAPADALFLQHGRTRICYLPDVADLPDPQILRGCSLYIGDGSSWNDALLREENGTPCGHAPIPHQLAWCREARVGEAILTHCGEQILGEEQRWQAELADQAGRLGLKAGFARDGMVLDLSVG